MATWTVTPLFERKEKQDNLLGLSDRAETIKKRYGEITSAGMELHMLMEVSAIVQVSNWVYNEIVRKQIVVTSRNKKNTTVLHQHL